MGRGLEQESVSSVSPVRRRGRAKPKDARWRREAKRLAGLASMKSRRRERRRNRRLGRSYNPSPEALSAQVWYHGSPVGGLAKKDIRIMNNEEVTDIPGFYLASLKPASAAYLYPRGQKKEESRPKAPQIVIKDGTASLEYEEDPDAKRSPPQGACVYRVRVTVQNPLEREAPLDPRLVSLVKEVFDRVNSGKYPRQEVEDMLQSLLESNRINDSAISFMVNGLREIIANDEESSSRAREELNLLPKTFISHGWDCLIRRMRSSLSDGKRSALDTAEELTLFDPENQIEEFTDGKDGSGPSQADKPMQ